MSLAGVEDGCDVFSFDVGWKVLECLLEGACSGQGELIDSPGIFPDRQCLIYTIDLIQCIGFRTTLFVP